MILFLRSPLLRNAYYTQLVEKITLVYLCTIIILANVQYIANRALETRKVLNLHIAKSLYFVFNLSFLKAKYNDLAGFVRSTQFIEQSKRPICYIRCCMQFFAFNIISNIPLWLDRQLVFRVINPNSLLCCWSLKIFR